MEEQRRHTFTTVVEETDVEGLRADKYIAEYLRLFTRSQLKQRGLEIFLDGKAVKPSKAVYPGAALEIRYGSAPSGWLEAEPIPLTIVYEDEDVVVVHKEQGMVVHPAAGNFSGTLVQGLLYHISALKAGFPEQELRPGIVHRLDKETSGVIIAAKHIESFSFLSAEFAERRVRKHYLAEVAGRPHPASGRISYPIARDRHNRKRFTWKRGDGKESLSLYRRLREVSPQSSLVLLQPKTGRTHQLRVHMNAIGHPIVGDPVYGKTPPLRSGASLMLHAYSLSIRLPSGGRRTFRAPLPLRFRRLLSAKEFPLREVEDRD